MTNELKILLLEDNPFDAKLIEFELKKSNLTFSLRNVDDQEGFIDELTNFKPDIILSDFNLPNFHGLDALAISKIHALDTPFILVTGNLDEETAVSCIKLGAWDYILKEKLIRLVPSINSSLKLKEEKIEKNKAIDDLKNSEAKYQDLYDNAPDMFLSLNPINGIIINCNQTLLKKLGYSREEFIGHAINEFYTKETSKYTKEVLYPLFAKSGNLKGSELQVVKKDGSIIDVSLTNSGIYNDNGQIIQTRSIWRDITEKKQTEETIRKSEERYRTMLDAMQDIVIIISPDYNITYMNSTATKKSKSRNFSKKCYQTLYGIEDVCKDCKVPSLSSQETYYREINDPQENSVYLASFSPIKNIDGSDSIMCTYKDITSLRYVENELRQEKTLLSKRVDERTVDLSRLNAELEKALRMKDEFLANMSHELRTPLNSILGLSEVLEDEIYGPLNQNQQKSVKTIEDSGRHLLALINDILDVAKIEAGKIELEIGQFSIVGICQASLNFIKQTALKKNISYNLKIETALNSIIADERRIKQILINLLSNAVKFTPQNGEIGLDVYENKSDESISFKVWDKGIGIKPENIQKLFKPFVQIDSSLSREYAGTGLGLTLVKSLTELHGGCVTVESVEGQGSEFTITIPSKIYQNNTDQDNTGEFQLFAQNMQNDPLGKIFIIEDATTEFEYLSIFKDQLGIEYKINRDSPEIIRSIEQFKPDIIIIDKELTNLSSWDTIKNIKSNHGILKTPLILLTKTGIDKECGDNQLTDCVIKPLTEDKLELLIMKYINKSNKQEPQKTIIEKASILIAEDNENNIEMLKVYFRKLNYKLLLARNGKEAVNIAQEQIPDIILMDIQMPEMDGIEATRIIRSHFDEKVSTIPIIALTALAMPGDKQKCLDAGINEYIKKPLSLKHLKFKIEEILALKT